MSFFCLAAIEYALPTCRRSLLDLERAGRLESPAATLASFGFAHALVSECPAETLAHDAVAHLIERHAIDPESVDALFYAGALPASHACAPSNDPHWLDGFNYPAARLQYDLGLVNATACGLGQVGCLGLMSAIGMAIDWLTARPHASRALAVSADVLPSGSSREILYNLISDGACAVLVERGAGSNRVVARRQVTKGYYWNSRTHRNEIVAAYFPTARAIVMDLLREQGLALDDIARVIPHNVSRRSWEILLGLLPVPVDRLYTDNIASKGHVIAADNLINLKDAADAGTVRRGDRLLLFNFGFGANWAAWVVEH
jgi:3-oxoacyl-[acyl-carrier-protein] synthase-3